MLLILFMVSISSLRSGWIWTDGTESVKQLFKVCQLLKVLHFYYIYLIHGPDLQSQLVHHSDEELKVKEGERKGQTMRHCLTYFPTSTVSNEKYDFFFFYCQQHKQDTRPLPVSYCPSTDFISLSDFMSWDKKLAVDTAGNNHSHSSMTDQRMSQIEWNHSSHLVLELNTLNHFIKIRLQQFVFWHTSGFSWLFNTMEGREDIRKLYLQCSGSGCPCHP